MKSGSKTDSGKERNMAAFNRNYSLYSEKHESSLEKHTEWGLVLMHPYKGKQM